MSNVRFKEEEGVLNGSKFVVKIPEEPKCRCAVVGCRGWAYRGRFVEGLHRHLDPIGNVIAERGYYWASTDYGAGGYPVKAAINSIRLLIEHLRRKYSIEKVALLGVSMGGHIALMYAIEYPEDVCCIVDVYGVADPEYQVKYVLKALLALPVMLIKIGKPEEVLSALKFLEDIRREFGGLPLLGILSSELKQFSPIRRAGELNVPVLVVHGDKDYVVPLEVSLRFVNKLKSIGKENLVKLVIVKNGGHDEYTIRKALKEILDFIEKRFYKNV